MSSPFTKLVIKSKIWIEDENGDLIFGSGRMKILKAVEKHGSILAAAKELRMSYRAAWGKIKAIEERIGKPLLHRRTGGASGGGSDLTPVGKELIRRFEYLDNIVKNAADKSLKSFLLKKISLKKQMKMKKIFLICNYFKKSIP